MITLFITCSDASHKMAQKSSQHKIKLYASPWVTPTGLLARKRFQIYDQKSMRPGLIIVNMYLKNILINKLNKFQNINLDFLKLINKMDWVLGNDNANEPNAFPNFLKMKRMERDFAKNYIGPDWQRPALERIKLNFMPFWRG